jgi:response regulator of citrate/malate metabolism
MSLKKLKKQFKIVVLEDNEFYNNILSGYLKKYTDEMSYKKDFCFDIESYTTSQDCLRNLKPNTDIAIIDYYLGESTNGLNILNLIKEKCMNCKVIIISQFRNIKTYYQTLNEGAYHFIFKDKDALAKSGFVIEDIINDRLRAAT